MSNNDITITTQDEASPANDIQLCKKCGAKWEIGADICPWCGADKSGTQILPLNFFFPKIEPKESNWNKKRPVPIGKAILILLLSMVAGAVLYYLLPVILAFSIVLKMVILALLVYAAVSMGIYYGISALFKLFINVWGKGNSTWLTVLTSLIIFVPSALRNTIVFWSAGGVQGIMSLIMGCAIPILGIVGIALYNDKIGGGKFCPYCDSNVFLRKSVIIIHSCNTSELIRRINENESISALTDLGIPEVSRHAFTAVHMNVCKKQDCRHAQIYVNQHMMYETYNKQNKQWQANDMNQLIAEHEISGETYDQWTEGWDKKDSLA